MHCLTDTKSLVSYRLYSSNEAQQHHHHHQRQEMIFGPHHHHRYHDSDDENSRTKTKPWWAEEEEEDDNEDQAVSADEDESDVLEEVLREVDELGGVPPQQQRSSSSSPPPIAPSSLASKQLGARVLAHHLACAMTVSFGSICQAALLSPLAQWLWAAGGYVVVEEGVSRLFCFMRVVVYIRINGREGSMSTSLFARKSHIVIGLLTTAVGYAYRRGRGHQGGWGGFLHLQKPRALFLGVDYVGVVGLHVNVCEEREMERSRLVPGLCLPCARAF